MVKDNAKERLLALLEKEAFDPILRAKEGDFPGRDRDALRHAQKATTREKERFRHYANAEEVVVNFKRDVHSAQAALVNEELARLHLPRLADVESDFFHLCDRLGVEH